MTAAAAMQPSASAAMIMRGTDGCKASRSNECCGCSCHAGPPEMRSHSSAGAAPPAGMVSISELDRCVAMASAALQAKTRHIEAEQCARVAVERENLELRAKLARFGDQEGTLLVDDETAFIRSQIEALLKTKAVMSREASELSRANALLTAEVHLLSSELERVTQTPESSVAKDTPRQRCQEQRMATTPIVMPSVIAHHLDGNSVEDTDDDVVQEKLKVDATYALDSHATEKKANRAAFSSSLKKDIAMSPFLETPSPAHPVVREHRRMCYSDLSSMSELDGIGAVARDDGDANATAESSPATTDAKVKALYDELKNIKTDSIDASQRVVADASDNNNDDFVDGDDVCSSPSSSSLASASAQDEIITKERRAREHAETIATRAISLAMKLLNESNSKTGAAAISDIIESNTINKTPVSASVKIGTVPNTSPSSMLRALQNVTTSVVGSPVVSMSAVISDNLAGPH